ncbi:MAG: hypothetical protein COA62_12940 [Rhodobiaceae bacterium]|nr:MAG: hypothetical protein COA62_12940 [Rhodobiaceae bacterium]
MIRWLLHLGTRRMERATNYDATYMHEVIDTSTSAALKLSALPLLSQHRDTAPLPLWYGAVIASVLEGDCGPCAQLMVDMGLGQGVDPDLLRALLARDMEAAGEEAALGFRFAEAVMAGDPESETMRLHIEHVYGKRALIAVAYATAFCRTYPVLKRALGHGLACQRIKVGNHSETVIKKVA